MDKSALPYRPCVGIVLINADGKVFIGERIDTPGAWQMPQGGIDEGESIEQAAYRELAEEVGTDKADILKISEQTIRYNIPEDTLKKLPWGNQYQGQEQTWIAMRFSGEDTDIDLNSFDPPEFSAWKWMDADSVLNKIVPFKRAVYVEILDKFSELMV